MFYRISIRFNDFVFKSYCQKKCNLSKFYVPINKSKSHFNKCSI